jgi:AraC-like DNA-binding protein/mannose-6-phosphate isomerase-like protein (cupin superfamily)
MKRPRRAARSRIDRVPYRPPGEYGLDVEVFTLSEFRRRVSAEQVKRPQRVEFHEILYVTEGRCTHTVDFEEWTCRPGTLLVLRPGQVQRFEAEVRDCEGWMVLFRAGFLAEGSALSAQRVLTGAERSVVSATLARMSADTRLPADRTLLSELLRHQLSALLVRLRLAEAGRSSLPPSPDLVKQRFQRFQAAIDSEVSHHHKVSDYARQIGCSTKSLQRAVLEMRGVSAKTLLLERITLEAKRLLAHTDEPVSAIAEALGFDEATNFVKFFRRESGKPPGAFRRQLLSL